MLPKCVEEAHADSDEEQPQGPGPFCAILPEGAQA